MTKGSLTAAERVFSGVFPTGISYADRLVEVAGDYKPLAFLPFSTLVLEWRVKRVPEDVRAHIEADAARIIARRGQDFQVSSAGQTVRLGSGAGALSGVSEKSPAQIRREIDAALAGSVPVVKTTPAQRRILVSASKHKHGHVIGGDPRVREKLADLKLIEVYGHHFGPLYEITAAGRSVAEGE